MFALNPFSGPALIAMVLAIINLVWVATKFKETLPSANRGNTPNTRSLNPFKRLSSLKFPGVVRINFIYLLYLVAFAAIEFTLTFLAKERFDFTHMQMAYMFVFVGFIIAIVQGGFVRRLAPKYGERLIARIGMLCTVPGFLLIGGASTVGGLYNGLAFMAIGSALVMPCLSALVSRYTPPDRQGLSLGVFRSMGSLSRAAGPVLGALVYWKFDSESAYRAGALLLLIPIYLAFKLPAAPEEQAPEPSDA
jgi:MFS family permease